MTINFPYKGKTGADVLWFVFLPSFFFAIAAYPWLADVRTTLIGNIHVPGRFTIFVALGIIAGAIIIGRWLRFWLVVASVAMIAVAFFYS